MSETQRSSEGGRPARPLAPWTGLDEPAWPDSTWPCTKHFHYQSCITIVTICNDAISIIIIKIYLFFLRVFLPFLSFCIFNFFPLPYSLNTRILHSFRPSGASPGTGWKMCVRYCHCFQISSLLMSKIFFFFWSSIISWFKTN